MKGNMFLGYARGSIGDVTFSRSKGQQVARARNRQPNNPRTGAQMTQRTVFMDAVKFYARGVQQFFKFAFEDKKSNESDYNAFMRRNAKMGIYLRKQDYENPYFPAIGKFTLTYGSIVPPRYQIMPGDEDNTIAVVGELNQSDSDIVDIVTVGQLSQQIKSTYGLLEGDIVTMVAISSGATLNQVGDYTERGLVILDESKPVIWNINQFIINTNDFRLLSEVGIKASRSDWSYEVNGDSLSAAGGVIVFSRKTATGLKVSTAVMSLNAAADDIYGEGMYEYTDPTWLEVVKASWSAREDAILEGSLTSLASSENVPLVLFVNLPATVEASTSLDIARVNNISEFEGSKLNASVYADNDECMFEFTNEDEDKFNYSITSGSDEIGSATVSKDNGIFAVSSLLPAAPEVPALEVRNVYID